MSAPTLQELLRALEARIPLSRSDRGDPVGLQIGDVARPLRHVAICHEVTEAVVAEVVSDPVDLLIAYHPLFYAPTRSLRAGATPEGRALRLAAAGVALAVVHTGFDAAEGGVADALADALELEGVEPFGPLEPEDSLKLVTFLPADAADAVLDAAVRAGAAKIGSYTHCSFRSAGEGSFYAGEGTSPRVGARGELNRESELRLEFALPRARESAVRAALRATHPYEEPAYELYERRGEAGFAGRVGGCEPPISLRDLAQRAGEALRAEPVRAAGDPERVLSRVAVVPGSGSSFRAAALAAGAQVLVTGDWTHHRAREALDAGLAVIDPGHAASERPGIERLFACVASLSRVPVRLLERDPDPWWSG